MKTFSLLLILFTLFTRLTAQLPTNLIQNGTFTQGTQGWFLGEHEGASGKIEALPATAADPARLRFTLLKPGTEHWTVQLIHGNVPLRQGQSYRITFRARADRYRVFGVALQMGKAPWKTIDGKWDVSCGTDWTPVEVVLKSYQTMEFGRLQIGNLGKNRGWLEITDISVAPVTRHP